MWTEIKKDDRELINKFLSVVWQADPMYQRICSFGGIVDGLERGDHYYFLLDDGESQIALGLRWKRGRNMYKLINGSLLGPMKPEEAAILHIEKCVEFLKSKGQTEAYWHRPSFSENPITEAFHQGMAKHYLSSMVKDENGTCELNLRVP